MSHAADDTTGRRRLIQAAALAAALGPLRHVAAQARQRGGDWLAMVKAQHQLIAKTLDELVANTERQGLYVQRDRLLRTLSYQLTAHSVAEENVLYPALAIAGLQSESDKLYLDQAHAKVMNARLQLADATQRQSADWMGMARALRDAVLAHATQDEEARLYPSLQSQLDARRNEQLADAFEREFVAVKGRTWVNSPDSPRS